MKSFPADLALTIVTNSPQIASVLSGRSNIELILLGGKIYSHTGSTLGSEPVNQIRGMIFDQTFIGVCGLDPQVGMTAVYYEDACFKKEVLAQSNEVVAAVTADKVSQIARYKVVACEDIDIVVVSSDANIDNFRHLNMRIEVAEE